MIFPSESKAMIIGRGVVRKRCFIVRRHDSAADGSSMESVNPFLERLPNGSRRCFLSCGTVRLPVTVGHLLPLDMGGGHTITKSENADTIQL